MQKSDEASVSGRKPREVAAFTGLQSAAVVIDLVSLDGSERWSLAAAWIVASTLLLVGLVRSGTRVGWVVGVALCTSFTSIAAIRSDWESIEIAGLLVSLASVAVLLSPRMIRWVWRDGCSGSDAHPNA